MTTFWTYSKIYHFLKCRKDSMALCFCVLICPPLLCIFMDLLANRAKPFSLLTTLTELSEKCFSSAQRNLCPPAGTTTTSWLSSFVPRVFTSISCVSLSMTYMLAVSPCTKVIISSDFKRWNGTMSNSYNQHYRILEKSTTPRIKVKGTPDGPNKALNMFDVGNHERKVFMNQQKYVYHSCARTSCQKDLNTKTKQRFYRFKNFWLKSLLFSYCCKINSCTFQSSIIINTLIIFHQHTLNVVESECFHYSFNKQCATCYSHYINQRFSLKWQQQKSSSGFVVPIRHSITGKGAVVGIVQAPLSTWVKRAQADQVKRWFYSSILQ